MRGYQACAVRGVRLAFSVRRHPLCIHGCSQLCGPLRVVRLGVAPDLGQGVAEQVMVSVPA